MAAEFVTVLSKSPLGITLDLDTSEWLNKAAPGMVPVTRVIKGKLPPVTLKGTAYRQGIDPPPLLLNGYASTQVPKAFWDQWLKTHSDFGPLLDGFIKVSPSLADAPAVAADSLDDRGMNPRLIEGDTRTANLGTRGVSNPTVADEQVAKFAA